MFQLLSCIILPLVVWKSLHGCWLVCVRLLLLPDTFTTFTYLPSDVLGKLEIQLQASTERCPGCLMLPVYPHPVRQLLTTTQRRSRSQGQERDLGTTSPQTQASNNRQMMRSSNIAEQPPNPLTTIPLPLLLLSHISRLCIPFQHESHILPTTYSIPSSHTYKPKMQRRQSEEVVADRSVPKICKAW